MSQTGCNSANYLLRSNWFLQPGVTWKKGTIIQLKIDNPMVEYHIEELSYDLQSLVGEIGGTLGLTIGLSFLSISEWIADIIKKFLLK